MGYIYIFFKLQYGPIVDIDLKVPPRPPGYAFVEVGSKFSFLSMMNFSVLLFSLPDPFFILLILLFNSKYDFT